MAVIAEKTQSGFFASANLSSTCCLFLRQLIDIEVHLRAIIEWKSQIDDGTDFDADTARESVKKIRAFLKDSVEALPLEPEVDLSNDASQDLAQNYRGSAWLMDQGADPTGK